MMKRKSLQTALLAAVMGVVSMPHAVLAAEMPHRKQRRQSMRGLGISCGTMPDSI